MLATSQAISKRTASSKSNSSSHSSSPDRDVTDRLRASGMLCKYRNTLLTTMYTQNVRVRLFTGRMLKSYRKLKKKKGKPEICETFHLLLLDVKFNSNSVQFDLNFFFFQWSF